MADRRIVSTIVDVGPFFSGDTGPTLNFILLWDTGGYVDITGAGATCHIRRWDPRRERPYGPIVTEGDCSVTVPAKGECEYDWEDGSPVASVPVDPGWYVAQLTIEFATGQLQHTQRAAFEVLPNTA